MVFSSHSAFRRQESGSDKRGVAGLSYNISDQKDLWGGDHHDVVAAPVAPLPTLHRINRMIDKKVLH